MARKRTELGPAVETRIVALMRTGKTAEIIAAQLSADGVSVSRATVGRRMKELSGRVVEERAKVHVPAPPPPDLPASPEEIPEGASLTQLDGWIRQAESAINTAESEGDLALMGTLLRVAASLAETRRKATPPERQDPNDSPDMIAMAKQVGERLHKMVDLVAKGRV